MDQTEVVNRRLELQGGHGIRHRGHPLDTSRDAAIRDAALDLLSEIGYDRLTMDAVAARAHASKATIYRRWQGKAALVVDALNCSKGSMLEPDTGSLAGDFAAFWSRHRAARRVVSTRRSCWGSSPPSPTTLNCVTSFASE